MKNERRETYYKTLSDHFNLTEEEIEDWRNDKRDYRNNKNYICPECGYKLQLSPLTNFLYQFKRLKISCARCGSEPVWNKKERL